MGIFNKKQNARSKKGLTEAEKVSVDRNPAQGLDGSRMVEALPTYIKTANEKIFKNENNAWIVLGRDRPAGVESGYGGAAADRCGSIDLVVGRLAGYPVGADTEKFVDSSFTGDAARIYISQRADIDKYFDLVDGGVGNSENRSAIGIKADSVRIMARQGVKIVASLDEDISTTQKPGPKSKYGIDLLSGNYDEKGFLQPIPKGENLRRALWEIVDAIEDNTKILNSFITAQVQYNTFLSGHGHELSPVPVVSSPSLCTYNATQALPKMLINGKVPAGKTARQNLLKLKLNYLKPGGAIYINSKLNRTT